MPAPTLAPVNVGDTVNASLINNITANLQAVAGATETGYVYIGGGAYATNAVNSAYCQSLSINSTPVSVSTSTTNSHMNAPGTSHLSVSGFQCYTTGTAQWNTGSVNGTWTIQY